MDSNQILTPRYIISLIFGLPDKMVPNFPYCASKQHICRPVRRTRKSDYYLRHVFVRPSAHPSVRLSIYPHGTTLLSLDGFSWNLAFEYISKLCWKKSNFIKILQEWLLFYLKNYIHLVQYPTEIFSEWEIFQSKLVQKIEKKFYVQKRFPRNSVSFLR